MVNRREFLRSVATGAIAMALPQALFSKNKAIDKPNIILCMADDMGWSDPGFNGNKIIKTPNLDAMAKAAMRFTRFYSGAPVCSPTRGSCLTGRHPYRYGIFFANAGHMLKEEFTLAEVLKTQGYTTGHFGKWHLGTLTTKEKDSNRGGPGGAKHYSPPWVNGFDVCFSTEAKVPTWNPMKNPDTNEPKPFFTVIWFHTPHLPVVTGPKYRKIYSQYSEDEQHYYGCITALDEQIGRLRSQLRQLGIADNTMFWFCSDNGPEGKDGKHGRTRGSAGPLRGRKRSLFEGGVRVPGLLEWPDRIKAGRITDIPCSTSDYFPTVLDVLGFKMKGQPQPIDGVSLLPLINGKMVRRPVPIAFESKNQVSLTDNRYKIYSSDKGKTYMLFDLLEDPGETKDLAAEKPQILQSMKATLVKWRKSCQDSLAGKDYK